MTIATILALLSKFGTFLKDSWPFVKKNWKNILLIGFLVWIIVCCLSHCRHVSPWDSHVGNIDTVSVITDTVWQYADTSAIFALYGFDTLPDYVHKLESRKQFKPTEPVIVDAVDCRDSIDAYTELLTNANLVITDCDSNLEDATAVRHYSDKLENDSIEVSVAFNVSGKLLGEPNISYRYLAPYPVITETITVKETVTIGSYRKVYIEGGIGPTMTWGNDLYAISGSAGLGYTDKKNWSYGARGTFNQNGYTVEAAVRKSFNVGK